MGPATPRQTCRLCVHVQAAVQSSCGSSCWSCCSTRRARTTSRGPATTGSSVWATRTKWRGAGARARTSRRWTTRSWVVACATTTTRTLFTRRPVDAMSTASSAICWPLSDTRPNSSSPSTAWLRDWTKTTNADRSTALLRFTASSKRRESFLYPSRVSTVVFHVFLGFSSVCFRSEPFVTGTARFLPANIGVFLGGGDAGGPDFPLFGVGGWTPTL